MSYKIDRNSDTWMAIEAWANAQRREAIDSLIADHHSEQQRGKIEFADSLLKLKEGHDEPVIVSDSYT